MKGQWLNFILHFTALISRQKNKLLTSPPLATIPLAFSIMVLEAALFLFSLPAYIFISPITLGAGDAGAVASYRLRRIVSLSVVLGMVGIWFAYLLVGFLGGALFPGKSHAFSSTWDFNNPLLYAYDSSKIQIVDGVAIFHASQTEPITAPVDATVETGTTGETTVAPTTESSPSVDTNNTGSLDTGTSVDSGTSVDTSGSADVTAPVTEPAPTPVSEPVSAPAPAPSVGGLGVFNTLAPSPLFHLASAIGSVLVETVHAQTLSCTATLRPILPFVVAPLDHWSAFTEVATKNGGEIYYQLSDDAGVTWKYWNGSAWTLTLSPTDYNTATAVHDHIADFSSLTGSIVFQATMVNDCASEMQLLSIAVDYEQPSTGHALTTGNLAISFTDADGTPLTAATGTVYIAYLGEPAAKLTLSGDLDLTNQILGSALGSIWLSLGESVASTVNNVQLILPKTNSNASVRVCPGALAAVSILPGCVGETILNSGQSSGDGYALVNMDDSEHWYIEVSTTGTLALGAMEFVPETAAQEEIVQACGTILNASNLNPSSLLNSTLSMSVYSLSGTVTFSTTGQTDIIVRHENDDNFWKLVFADGTVQFVGVVDGIPTLAHNANVLNFAPQVGGTYHFNIQVNGAQLRAKWWGTSEAEVDSWLLYAADDRILTGGVGIAPSGTTLLPSATFANLLVSSCLADEAIADATPTTPESETPSVTPPVVDISLPSTDPVVDLTTPEIITTTTEEIAAPQPIVEDVVLPPSEIMLEPTADPELSVVVVVDLSETAVTTSTVIVDISDVVEIVENTDGTLDVTVGNTTTVTVTTPDPISTDEPHIIIVTDDGENVDLYIDGTLVDSAPATPETVPDVTVPSVVQVIVDEPAVVPTVEVVQSVLSTTQINTIELTAQNQAPLLVITSAAQQNDDGFVDIHYRAGDAESNYISLVQYEYSLTGAFAGEQQAMTLATADADNEGTQTLATTPLGVAHTLVWDARADLGNAYASAVFIRLRVNDGLENGSAVIGVPFAVDVKSPVVTNLTNQQVAGYADSRAAFTLFDDATSTIENANLEISFDSGLTWEHVSATWGYDSAVSGPQDIVVTWAPPHDTPVDQVILLRITSVDPFGNTSITEPITTNLDTKMPFGLANLEGTAANTTQIQWSWSPVAQESHFDRYELWYGTDEIAVQNHSTATCSRDALQCVSAWTDTQDAGLDIMGTHTTIITGLVPGTTYYAEISAYDSFGHYVGFNTVAYATLSVVPDNNATSTSVPVSVSGGGAVSQIIENVLPSDALVSPTAPAGGFDITINTDDRSTASASVTLALRGGDDAATMAISNYADLHDAVQVPYSTTAQWHLCTEQGGLVTLSACENGTHTVYVKFYTEFGQSSRVVSDNIILNIPVVEVSVDTPVTQENVSVGGSSGGSSGSSGSRSTPSVGSGNTIPANVNNALQPQVDVNGNAIAESEGVANTNASTGAVAQNKPSAPNAETNAIVRVAAVSSPVLEALSTTKESPILALPKVGAIQQTSVANTIEFTGTGIPNAKVALFLHSDQVVVYTTQADEKGEWRLTHDQKKTTLASGEHTVYAVTYDEGSGIKSKPTPVKTFFVKQNHMALVLSHFDMWTTALTLLLALFGLLFLLVRRGKIV